MFWTALTIVFTLFTIGLLLWMFWNKWPNKRIVETLSWYSLASMFIFILVKTYDINQVIGLPDIIYALLLSILISLAIRLFLPRVLIGGNRKHNDVNGS